MMYSKKQIADALVKFINTDLMDSEIDTHSRFSLCMAKKAIKENPDILDKFFESPIVASIIKVEGDEYDLDALVRTMKSVFADKQYSILLPKVPLFAPKDRYLNVTVEDIDKIVSYLQPVM